MDLFGIHLQSLAGAVATFAAVYGVFAKFDGDQSDNNRKFVRDWLTGIKVDEQRWNKVIEELFTNFFGTKHWSWKCLRRSLILSGGLMVAAFIVWGVRSNAGKEEIATLVWLLASAQPSFGLRHHLEQLFGDAAIYFSIAGIADFLSLWKTRYILTRVSSFANGLAIVATVAGDFIATTLILIAIFFLVWCIWLLVFSWDLPIAATFAASFTLRAVNSFFVADWNAMLPRLLYAASLLTSAWLWVYLIVAYGMRAISHLPSWVKLLSKVTDFDDHPVRSIGYLAAGVNAAIVAIVTLV